VLASIVGDALLGKGLAVRMVLVAHHFTGAPLLHSSGAPKSGAPLVTY
jgi:NAD(P)H-hydrate repair Nnr-like enzyme with NAD(P)H-hydrate dehydratase domain